MRIEIRKHTSESVTIGFTGDFVPSSASIIKSNHLKSIIESCDFIVTNLEGPLTDAPSQRPESMTSLFSPPTSVNELVEMNMSLVNIANNHIMDCGLKGLTETIHLLIENGLTCIGAGENIKQASNVILKDNLAGHVNMAFLAYSYIPPYAESMASDETAGANPFSFYEAVDEIKKHHENGRVVCVLYHGGRELCQMPSPIKRSTLRGLVEAGADIIIGHHPHVFQGIELMDGRIVAHSLGNFYMSTQYLKLCKGTDIGIVLTIDIDANGPFAYNIYFVYANADNSTLSVVHGTKEKELTRFTKSISGVLYNWKKYKWEWRRDCVCKAFGLNYVNKSSTLSLMWKLPKILSYECVKKIISIISFGRKSSYSEIVDIYEHKFDNYEIGRWEFILAVLLGIPYSLFTIKKTFKGYDIYKTKHDEIG